MIIGIKDFYRGDTKKYRVKLTDKNTHLPISVDGGKLTITFKKNQNVSDADADIQVAVTGQETDINNPTGIIDIILTAIDTEIEPGFYYYDFQFVSAAGEVQTLLSGKMQILTDITRTI